MGGYIILVKVISRYKSIKGISPLYLISNPVRSPLRKNTALRLSISGSAFPAYALNKGDSQEAQTITLRVFCTEESFLRL